MFIVYLRVLVPDLDRPLEDAGVGRVDPVKQHHVTRLQQHYVM